MDHKEQRQVERLFGLLADCQDGDRGSIVGDLEELLLHRPDLQEHYARLVGTSLLLQSELSMSGPSGRSHVMGPHVPIAAVSKSRASSDSALACRRIADRLDRADRRKQWVRRGSWAVSAVVLFALGWAGLRGGLSPRAGSPSPSSSSTADALVTTSAGQPSGGCRGSLRVNNSETLVRLQGLNRTSALTSLLLPRNKNESHPVMLCSGAAWMDYATRDRQRGYLVTLAPGERMDALFDASAWCQNTVSVVEIDGRGGVTGRAWSYTNGSEQDDRSDSPLSSELGQFSEFNDGSSTRYFLLSGSHQDQPDTDEAPWRPSDFLVHLNAPGMLVIGWDDSTYSDRLGDIEPRHADCDYNDIRVVLRFSGTTPREPRIAAARYYPLPSGTLQTPPPDVSSYAFQVRPGEEAVLRIAHGGGLASRLRVIEQDTRNTIWRNDRSAWGESPTHHANAYLIRNDGDEARGFELVAEVEGQASQPKWLATQHREIEKEPHRTFIGFKGDGRVDPDPNPDLPDVLVDIRWFLD